MQRAKVSLANMLVLQSLQSRDNPNQAPRLDGDGVEKGADGSEDAVNSSELRQEPLVLSLDVQDVALFQARAGLVLVKKALQGPDVHCMVQVHHFLSRILNFWHCDWLPNYGGDGVAIRYNAPGVAKEQATSVEKAWGKA